MRTSITWIRLGVIASLLTTTGCDSPTEAEASQQSTMAMFAEIIDKLESIDARLDTLEATVDATSGGSLTLTGLPAAQLDSVLALASFLAGDVTSGAWEACGKVGLALDFGLELAGEAEGEAIGSIGAWAGTGAFAGAEIKAKGALGGSGKMEGEGGVEYCQPLFVESPPVRALPQGPSELEQIRTTLTSLTTQFGLDAAALNASLGSIGTAISSPGSLDLGTLGDQLPLPPNLAAMANDPLGAASARLQGLSQEAQTAMCGSISWGPNLSTIIDDACDLIGTGGLGSVTALADMMNTYPAVRTAMSNACTRVNAIGLQRLVIPSRSITIGALGTYQVFPGYDERLFPSYTAFACP